MYLSVSEPAPPLHKSQGITTIRVRGWQTENGWVAVQRSAFPASVFDGNCRFRFRIELIMRARKYSRWGRLSNKSLGRTDIIRTYYMCIYDNTYAVLGSSVVCLRLCRTRKPWIFNHEPEIGKWWKSSLEPWIRNIFHPFGACENCQLCGKFILIWLDVLKLCKSQAWLLTVTNVKINLR